MKEVMNMLKCDVRHTFQQTKNSARAFLRRKYIGINHHFLVEGDDNLKTLNYTFLLRLPYPPTL